MDNALWLVGLIVVVAFILACVYGAGRDED